MSKNRKMGVLKDVNPDDVVDLVKTAGKIIRDLLKKDNTDKQSKK